MVVAASAVTGIGTVTGVLSALGDGHGSDRARPEARHRPAPASPPAVPPPATSERGTSAPVTAKPTPTPGPVTRTPAAARSEREQRLGAMSPLLYRHPDSRAQDWVRAHPDDPRAAVIASRIAEQPAAVWFTDPGTDTVAARVRAVTAGAAARGRVPVLVPYAIPDRDCGGASQGGAADLAAYDAWIDAFAEGLGSGEVIVILEPDSIAQSDCLTEADRAARFASLARAGRVMKTANPQARVYYDAGHSGWHPPDRQAALLRQAGAASFDGIFSNVSNFRATADEIAYDRQVLDALGGPADLGAVIDTSRNGNGAPPDGRWCDPPGRKIGRAPNLTTGEARIDAYLWVKLPGASDGCKGPAGTFDSSYAYELARGASGS
ncbi:glycoside hydrolase family 6 protein [Streptomyces sp. NPDC048521]|uniref:glycoside hydrolase family 6 protein n=1 Tax=Streptomyces sp. NPDC048521 TaxID=3365566 RepID=UPI003718231E